MPTFIGQYEVKERLGGGDASAVFLCRAPLGMPVVVKVFQGTDATDRARFQRETWIQSQMSAAHGFVPLLDQGVAPAGPYLVMPHFPGGTLRERLEDGALDVPQAIDLARSLAQSMGHAHARGIIHRDLKPENILFTADRRPVIADLGLAKSVKGAEPLTRPDEVLGSIGYMAPEQLLNQLLSPATDVFALGAIIYECLTSNPVFPGESVAEIAGLLTGRQKITPLRQIRPEVPAPVAIVIERALEIDPARRWQDGYQLAQALGARPRPPTGRWTK